MSQLQIYTPEIKNNNRFKCKKFYFNFLLESIQVHHSNPIQQIQETLGKIFNMVINIWEDVYEEIK